MSDDWKRCPNGHFYKGSGPCPHCLRNKHLNGHLNEYYTGIVEPPKPEVDDPAALKFGLSPSKENKVCPNHHAYSGSSPMGCPYCGEWKVIGYADMHTGEGYHFICRGANQIIKVTINGVEYSLHDMKVGYWVWDWANRIKSSYCLEIGPNGHPIVGGEDCVFIHCHDEIVIGPTKMTGKEFIKMCDVIIDNQLAIIGM